MNLLRDLSHVKVEIFDWIMEQFTDRHEITEIGIPLGWIVHPAFPFVVFDTLDLLQKREIGPVIDLLVLRCMIVLVLDSAVGCLYINFSPGYFFICHNELSHHAHVFMLKNMAMIHIRSVRVREFWKAHDDMHRFSI
jgi:hypothetical protein